MEGEKEAQTRRNARRIQEFRRIPRAGKQLRDHPNHEPEAGRKIPKGKGKKISQVEREKNSQMEGKNSKRERKNQKKEGKKFPKRREKFPKGRGKSKREGKKNSQMEGENAQRERENFQREGKKSKSCRAGACPSSPWIFPLTRGRKTFLPRIKRSRKGRKRLGKTLGAGIKDVGKGKL